MTTQHTIASTAFWGPCAAVHRAVRLISSVFYWLTVAFIVSGCSGSTKDRATKHLSSALASIERISQAATLEAPAFERACEDEATRVRQLKAAIFALSAELERDPDLEREVMERVRGAVPRARRGVASWMGIRLPAPSRDEPPPPELADALPGQLREAKSLAELYRQSGLLEVASAALALAQVPKPGSLGGPMVGTLQDHAPNLHSWVQFARGAEVFRRSYGVKDGLGPGFNNGSCASCHGTPTLGGWGGIDRGAQFRVNPDLHREIIGIHRYHIPGVAGPTLPEGVTIAVRRAPPLYGVGLLDGIAVSAVVAQAKSNEDRGDGVAGFANDRVGQIARFGAKSHELSLRTFVAAALKDEMGITSAAHRCEDQLSDGDEVADPEIADRDFELLIHYVAHLGQPPNHPLDAEQRRGKSRFDSIGCGGCHLSSFEGVQGAYTDLLVHRMGPQLDNGLPEHRAEGDAWRTAPLWGLRHRPRYLHDDSAKTIEAAILKHGGEAERSRKAYQGLSREQQAEVLRFLGGI